MTNLNHNWSILITYIILFFVSGSRLKSCTALPCCTMLIDHTFSSLGCRLGMDYKLSHEAAKSGLQEKRRHVCWGDLFESSYIGLLAGGFTSFCVFVSVGSVCGQWPGPLCLQGGSGLQHRNLWHLPTDCCF